MKANYKPQIADNNTAESVLVGFDVKPNGNKVLIVGKKNKNKPVDIINAFQGEEAQTIWDMLTKKKETPKMDSNSCEAMCMED